MENHTHDMSDVYPVAKLGKEVLLVNKGDVSLIGTEDALNVLSVDVDLQFKRIEEPIELEKHLKFNPWEDVTDEERDSIIEAIRVTFTSEEINEKIIEPLSNTVSKDLISISERIGIEILDDNSALVDKDSFEKCINQYTDEIEKALMRQGKKISKNKIISFVTSCAVKILEEKLITKAGMSKTLVNKKLLELGIEVKSSNTNNSE